MTIRLAAIGACIFFTAITSHASVVLTIDITQLSAVKLIPVANNSSINLSLPGDFLGGITLRNFFTANEDAELDSFIEFSGSLKAQGMTTPYDTGVTINFADGTGNIAPGRDVSIYSSTESGNQAFSTATSPFTGLSTFSLSGFTFVPTVGTTGDIYAGYLPSSGGVIGQYTVVPEPSSLLWLGAGLLGAIRPRRRRSP